jgi:hypothetical protein
VQGAMRMREAKDEMLSLAVIDRRAAVMARRPILGISRRTPVLASVRIGIYSTYSWRTGEARTVANGALRALSFTQQLCSTGRCSPECSFLS